MGISFTFPMPAKNTEEPNRHQLSLFLNNGLEYSINENYLT